MHFDISTKTIRDVVFVIIKSSEEDKIRKHSSHSYK